MVETVTSIFKNKKPTEQHDLVKRLHDMGRSSDIANIILAIMVGSTVELSLGEISRNLEKSHTYISSGLVNMINLFVGSESAQSIQSLGTTGDLKGYALEAQSRSFWFLAFFLSCLTSIRNRPSYPRSLSWVRSS